MVLGNEHLITDLCISFLNTITYICDSYKVYIVKYYRKEILNIHGQLKQMALVDKIKTYPKVQDEAKFVSLIEASIPYYRKDPETSVIGVDLQQSAKFRFDFYGLCTSLGIDEEYHYATLRLNGLTSSQDFNGKMSSIVVPPLSKIDQLIEIALTKKE